MNPKFAQVLSHVATEVGKHAVGHMMDRRKAGALDAQLMTWGEEVGDALYRTSMRLTATILARHGVKNFDLTDFAASSGNLMGGFLVTVDAAFDLVDIDEGARGIRQWIDINDLDGRAAQVGRRVMEDMALGRTDFLSD